MRGSSRHPTPKEIRVPLRRVYQLIERVVREEDIRGSCRDLERGPRVFLIKGSDLGNLENSLGVRARFTCETRKLWQSRTDHHEREIQLRRPVHGDDERRQLLLGQMDLVNRDQRATGAIARCHGDSGDEQVRQIFVQSTGVGLSDERFGVELDRGNRPEAEA